MNQPALQFDLPLANPRRGKVRDVYDAVTNDGEPVTLLVASDRISAYDVVMPTPVPGKGALLTELSAFWFGLIGEELGDRFGHHLVSTDADDIAGLSGAQRDAVRGRVMLGRRCRVVPIECVARGYLAGSGWREYESTGEVCGVKLPGAGAGAGGLQRSERLPEPIFTPATKAAEGHDENITFDRAAELVGGELMEKLREWTLAVYRLAHAHAEPRGILLADTKLEFGIPVNVSGTDLPGAGAEPILIDEALTPDSSRFWPADGYRVGEDPPSFDKQYVRNHLESLVAAGRWDKRPPGPALPDDVVRNTLAKYEAARDRLMGDA
ncbi:MAG: phosphoribosylaminoimidazolesuccinocarboxamide synthase [Planctomycetota bacterium]